MESNQVKSLIQYKMISIFKTLYKNLQNNSNKKKLKDANVEYRKEKNKTI